MISNRNRRALAMAAALVLSVSGSVAAAPAAKHDYALGPLRIDHPRIPPTPNAAPTAAGYLTITNTGKQADRLVAISTPVADTVQPHHMSMAHGVMSMRPITGGVPIGPGQSVTFAPGGDHLMLIGLKHQLTAGQHARATLRFEHAGAITIAFRVEPARSAAPAMPGMAGVGRH
jgi:hypothetical protein